MIALDDKRAVSIGELVTADTDVIRDVGGYEGLPDNCIATNKERCVIGRKPYISGDIGALFVTLNIDIAEVQGVDERIFQRLACLIHQVAFAGVETADLQIGNVERVNTGAVELRGACARSALVGPHDITLDDNIDGGKRFF